MWKQLTVLMLGATLSACVATTHPSQRSSLGVTRRSAEMLAVVDQPGTLEVETIASADWVVPRSGMLNLDHPKAKAAHLEDGDEPIQVFFHVIRHPTRGTFIVDTGVERALRDDVERSAVSGLVRRAMHLEKMKVRMPLGDWLAKEQKPLAGVLMTHLHLDHISGMPDVPKGTPIYCGPGESSMRQFLHLFSQGTTNKELEGQAPTQEWGYAADADGRFDGVVDVFGDGSLWAIWVPGHTPGSTAYLARTAKGPVLFVGDTSHTAWGWHEGVEPGSFTFDQKRNADSLGRLRQLVAEHPTIEVRLGHQELH
jgi:glyoxylase-like metal-dependent hydrolase (beta-lactamase superfamily II)